MKRGFFAILALLLCLALTAKADQTFATRYFTLTIPDAWETDFDGLISDKTKWDLGYIYPSDTLCIRAELQYYEAWNDFSLWRADKAGMDEYTQALLDDYKEYLPKLTNTLFVGRIPFLLLELHDREGIFYWAETMTNGYAVGFECYGLSDDLKSYRDVTDAELEHFVETLKTFQPVY